MSVCVVLPWRDTGCPHRKRALDFILKRYAERHPEWQVAVGHHDQGEWCKALAVEAALQQTDSPLLVIADGDVWCEGLPEAVQRVQEGTPWAIPHRGVCRLTEASTAAYVAGAEPDGLGLAERTYVGVEGGGIVVLSRDTYRDCPLDARFSGWGQEDESIGFALRCLYGPPWRPRHYSPLWHCWHPEPPRASRARGSEASWLLRKRYAMARRDPGAMRRLVKEAYDALSTLEPQHDHRPALR